MSYQARVYNIMIASPSDVSQERQTIREAIFEWNYKHSHLNRMVLIPLGWETHAVPLLGEGQDRRGQKVINDMVLKNADVLVAIFKSRIGSPTGRSASGTIEEINIHRSLGKPVLRYFGKCISLHSVFLPFGKQAKHSRTVRAYKEECKKDGLIDEYGNVRELKEKFYGHLQLVANKIMETGKELSIESRAINVSGESLAIIDNLTPITNEKIKVLLIEALQDPKGEICITRLAGEPVVVRTNGKDYPNYENDLIYLEQNQWIKKSDEEGRIYLLTDLGYQEAGKIKRTSAN